MTISNFERMVKLAEGFFETKNDPSQISVTAEVMERLRQLHPASLTEQNDGRGPVAWILVIPTMNDLLKQFIAKEINEKQLLDRTPLHQMYDTIYLCSALVLPEYRKKGLAKRLTVSAIKSIQADYPIKSLSYWAFSVEGIKLATAVAKDIGLPLYKRPE